MIFTRTHFYLSAAILTLLSFTYYWNELRSPAELSGGNSEQKTIFYYLSPLDSWKKIFTNAWSLEQKTVGSWWISELSRPQSKLEIKNWQKDLGEVKLEAEINLNEASILAMNHCDDLVDFNFTIDLGTQEKILVHFCRPNAITGKFLIQITHDVAKISKKNEKWFWGFTDRPFEGLYRDVADRFSQSFQKWNEEWNDLSYVAQEETLLEWLGVKELDYLKVSFPKNVIFEINFLKSQLTPLPVLPLKIDENKVASFKQYIQNLRPQNVSKGKGFIEEPMISAQFNQIPVSVYWPTGNANVQNDISLIYLPKQDITLSLPGKEFAARFLFVQNFYHKKIDSLAKLFQKGPIQAKRKMPNGELWSRLIDPQNKFLVKDLDQPHSGEEKNEPLWQELACYAMACNSSHEFLRFYHARPSQLESLTAQEIQIDTQHFKIYPAQGVWWLEMNEKEFYLFAGPSELWK